MEATDLAQLYTVLYETVCHRSLNDLKLTLVKIPKDVITQLEYTPNNGPPTAIINTIIVQRYYQLHGQTTWDGTVKTPASSHSTRYSQLLESLKILLDHGFNPADTGPDEENGISISPVQLSAQTNDHKVLQLLLEAGADPTAHYNDDEESCEYQTAFDSTHPPFHLAARSGSCDTLQCLTKWSAQHPDTFPISEEDKQIALESAAEYQFPTVLEILLSSFSFSKEVLNKTLEIAVQYRVEGYNPYDRLYEFGPPYPPVHCDETDLWSAQIKTVRVLLEAGANSNHIDKSGNSLLRQAILTTKDADKDGTIVELLLDHGATVHSDPDSTELGLLAIRSGIPELARIFLERGWIPPEEVTATGTRTALHIAAAEAPVEAVRLLVSAGFDPAAKDTNDWSVFHYACKGCRVETLKYLLEFDPAVVNQPTPDGWTPLTIGYKSEAPYDYYEEAVQYVIEQGADMHVTTPTPSKYTLIHIAAKGGLWNLLEYLLEKGAPIIKSATTGATALHFMDCDDETFQGTKTLLKYGADVNAQDNQGRTLLHKLYSIDPFSAENKDLVKLLLQSGADPRIRDNEGKTAQECYEEIRADPNWNRRMIDNFREQIREREVE
ncbi:ankyrin repeat-containing domain protein [Aspergillus multicolor]|uniref:ankyrin repeat-containing domain protein n=1 Tax=Aspergillus multicolor TaxID=41759 RepID=UPI003CCD38E6